MRILRWKHSRRRDQFSTAPEIYSLSVTRSRLGLSVSVTITGRGFRNCPDGDPPTVLLGSLPATNVVVVDQNTITFDSPIAAAAGVVDVTITVGCCL